mmetsp:Transcript_3132/g.7212  ORF Transcript_3132/g.7212 Transcript_3132/m.7212 type:complete len:83 (-) Transcript_3132:391-639(-)
MGSPSGTSSLDQHLHCSRQSPRIRKNKNTAKGMQLNLGAKIPETRPKKATPIVTQTTKAAEMILMHIGTLPVWDQTILFAQR